MNKAALGLGIGFNTERDKADNDDDPAITRSISGDGAIYYYPIQKGAVAMYVAPEGGLELSTDYLKSVKDCSYYTLRGGLSLGVEWWVFDQVSLAASTWFGLQYQWGTEKDKILDTTDEPRNLKFGMAGSSADCIYISFYFK